MALRHPCTPACHLTRSAYHHPNSKPCRQTSDTFITSDSCIPRSRLICAVSCSYSRFPSIDIQPTLTLSSRPSARHSRLSHFRRESAVDSNIHLLSRSKRRGRTNCTVGAVSASDSGVDGPLAAIAGVSGSESYGEVLEAARSVLIGLPGRIDSAGLTAFKPVVPTNESIFNVYGGFFTHISTSLSDIWIGLQLPGGDATQTIIFYVAVLLLLYGLLLQPK